LRHWKYAVSNHFPRKRCGVHGPTVNRLEVFNSLVLYDQYPSTDIIIFLSDFVRGLLARNTRSILRVCPTLLVILLLRRIHSTSPIPHERPRPGGHNIYKRITPSLVPLQRRMTESNRRDLPSSVVTVRPVSLYCSINTIILFPPSYPSLELGEHCGTTFLCISILVLDAVPKICICIQQTSLGLGQIWGYSCDVMLHLYASCSLSDTHSVWPLLGLTCLPYIVLHTMKSLSKA
jgi:hypothetical protein